MSFQSHIQRLAEAPQWTFAASRQSAAEPAAWAALALAAHRRADVAVRPAAWLAELQQHDGAVGVSQADAEPRWPTSLALLAWGAVDAAHGTTRFKNHIAAAARWSLADHGGTAPRSPMIGHDTMLVGWSWAAGTHSWLEPTCFFVLALRAAGYGVHARTRQGVELIVDRLLPLGGANYGNTVVLGQPLLPHVLPSGVALWALQDEVSHDPRIELSLQYLESAVGPTTTPASLAWACLGLAAHGRRPREADRWLAAALDSESPTAPDVYEQALLLLAARPEFQWLPKPAQAAARTGQRVDLSLASAGA